MIKKIAAFAATVLFIFTASASAEREWLEPEFAEGDYAIAVIPDIQNMTRYYPDVLDNMFNWLHGNAEKRKIKFAVQVGDLTDANVTTEWMRVRENFAKLDGVVPYAFVLGNHDYYDGNVPERNSSFFNLYLPYGKHSQTPYFGGAYEENKMDNAYYHFAAGGTDYMVLCLEMLPRAPVVDWANEVVAANPDRRVIIATHLYMAADGGHFEYSYSPEDYSGKDIWDNLASLHENIIMVFGGHFHNDDIVMRADTGINGNVVHQFLIDAQDMDYYRQGVGMLAIMTFSDGGNDVAVNWYSARENALFKENNQFSFSIVEKILEEEEKTNTGNKSILPVVIIIGAAALAIFAAIVIRYAVTARGKIR